MMFKKTALLFALVSVSLAASAQAAPEKFTIDKAHTFVTFKVSHIGFGWIPGVFTNFEGDVSYDPEKPANSKVTFTVKVPSMTTFHAERDKHLKSDDFLTADEHETAKFVSTAYEPTGDNTANLRGDLTIKGVTKPVTFKVTELAGGEDPWGNFRRAWDAEAEVELADFGIDDFGGAAKTATVIVSMEATRAK